MTFRVEGVEQLRAGVAYRVLEERVERWRRWRWLPWPRVWVRVIERVEPLEGPRP